MAVIGKIRKRSGLLVAIIGIALFSFLFMGIDWNRIGIGRNDNSLGKIAGESITYLEFEVKAEEYITLYKEQMKLENLDPEQEYMLKQQAWQNLVRETLLQKEVEALGITVTIDELSDLVQGANPHPYIMQSFSDPATGMFNPATVVNFIQSLDQREPEIQKQWAQLEKSIKEDRLNTKYNNLLNKAYYIPTAFARRDFIDKNRAADINYVMLNFQSIADESISISKKDLEKAYEEHKHEFEVEEAKRSIEFLTFDILPSEEDRLQLEEDLMQIKEEFITTEDLAYFVNINSDIRYDSTFKKMEDLPLLFDSVIFDAEIGAVEGPFRDANSYFLARLVDVQNRPDSAKASHILIAYAGAYSAAPEITRTKEEAQLKADSLLNVIKRQPDLFGELARQFSDDGSVQQNNGDLDWFSDGAMVYEFNEACIKGRKDDKIVVETPFGFHVIHITDVLPAKKKVRVAIIQRDLTPSEETYQKIYADVNKFATDNKTIEKFNAAVTAQGLAKRMAENIKVMDNTIAGLSSPREIIRWAFDENTELNSISRIYEIEDKFVIAVLTEVLNEGFAELEDIKDEIEPFAIRNKKAEMLIEKMNAARASASSLEQMAQSLNSIVQKNEFIKFSSINLPAIGPEPNVIGTAFALEKGQISEPIIGNNGVFVISVSEYYEAPVVDNYDASSNMMKNFFIQRLSFELNKALEGVYKVVDNRNLYY
ncbi:MAG: SurA N-terminal domain-containing protein [Bacteroidales bacterium]|nr:SurA N-terminal domain-containing protein [Bacteroidales bacterium]